MKTEEVCPNCGRLGHLDNYYGWCRKCRPVGVKREVRMPLNIDCICQWCGGSVRNAGCLFCSKPECKKASKRYARFKYYGLSPEEALVRATQGERNVRSWAIQESNNGRRKGQIRFEPASS